MLKPYGRFSVVSGGESEIGCIMRLRLDKSDRSKFHQVQSHVSAHCLRVVCALFGCDLTRSLSHIDELILHCYNLWRTNFFFQVLNRAQPQANPIPSTIDTRKANA
jgi:hypothetical protein